MDTQAAERDGYSAELALDRAELFSFDVRGFIILRGALDAPTLAALGQGGFEGLLGASPLLRRYATALASPGSRSKDPVDLLIDRPPALLPQLAAGDAPHILEAGGNHERGWRTEIGPDSRVLRFARGLRAVFALSDSPEGCGGLHVVPASHTSGLPEAPSEVLSGELDLSTQVELSAGDCVLMASNLVSFRPPQFHNQPLAMLCVLERVLTDGRRFLGRRSRRCGPGRLLTRPKYCSSAS